MNIVKYEFEKLMEQMYKDKDISDEQKKDIEKVFYAGAFAVNIAILKSSDSDSPEEDLGKLFDFIQNKCQELSKD